jgi:hypothetical protein
MMPVVKDDPFGGIKDFKKPQNAPDPTAVNNFHSRSDVDSSATAQHHTLGVKHDQASPGDHKHDGRNSRKIMEGITITGSKGGNVALTNLINALSAALGFTDSTT